MFVWHRSHHDSGKSHTSLVTLQKLYVDAAWMKCHPFVQTIICFILEWWNFANEDIESSRIPATLLHRKTLERWRKTIERYIVWKWKIHPPFYTQEKKLSFFLANPIALWQKVLDQTQEFKNIENSTTEIVNSTFAYISSNYFIPKRPQYCVLSKTFRRGRYFAILTGGLVLAISRNQLRRYEPPTKYSKG